MKQLSYLFIATITCILYACDKNDNVFDNTPTQRKRQAIENLNNLLTNNKAGWLVIYFPKTDSLLFANPNDKIKFTYQYNESLYGYGGNCFTMRFLPTGQVDMRADFDKHTANTTIRGEYKIGANSSTQLTFLTTNYIHRLVNDGYQGACDWLYQGKNEDGYLVFKTASYLKPASEYIVMQPLKGDNDFNIATQQAYQNRQLFEQMKNPQLRIYSGGHVFFESDYYIGKNKKRTEIAKQRKYFLFMQVNKLDPNPENPPKEFSVLGSGYCATPIGITFRAGLRLNNKQVFADFQKVGNKFEAELVEVYKPEWRSIRLVSKHLHPEGKITGLRATIQDIPLSE